ncbi:MAG TPA: hypothetical protein VKM93_01170 [Terriglobia bacterium]|nr:hypothetical protein [Terriglobia bacterium]
MTQDLSTAASRLHVYLLRRHFRDGLLIGPDYGVRFNFRAWRFLKSALPTIRWGDDYVFMQTQGYWILANWLLYDRTGEPQYREIALATSDAILRLQTSEGFWAYPLPERRHLIATVEGCWASIGLLASYTHDPRAEFLAAVIRWYDFLVTRIGFQDHTQGKAVNYFDQPRGKVPNNSVLTAWFFLLLWNASRDHRFLEHVDGLFQFIAFVQRPSGELPYVIASPYERGREHYLCFQYNAFKFLELARCTPFDPGNPAGALMPSLARFLEGGATSTGASAVECASRRRTWPEVDYYTAVLAAALAEAAKLGLADGALSERCYTRLLQRQRPDGSFWYSTGDYGFLSDHRSYPRSQAMMLVHLLYGGGSRESGRKTWE